MQGMQLIQILEKTVSPDQNELVAAREFLEQAAAADMTAFIKALTDVVRHGENSPIARMAAALQLKNQLTSKDEEVKQEYKQRWLAFPAEVRKYIKENIVGALGTEASRPSTVAQCVAYVAVIELPENQWGDLIKTLVENVVQPTSTELQRESSLEAIGYICQEIESDVLAIQSNSILTAIIHGMRSSEPSSHVRLAATQALLNSLEFTKANFEHTSERNFIMQVVCETTQSHDPNIACAALQCLVKILSLYYQHMEMYMSVALFPITLAALKCENDAIALQGIEFWSNVSEEEIDLAVEEKEAGELGMPPARTSKHYARGALQYLVPLLLQKLTQQEEVDDDEWNPSKAAGVCLTLLAQCCENDVLPHVLPFVEENINSQDWRYRDASLMAFSSMMGGVDRDRLKPLVEQAMQTLIQLMYDSSVVVRDTAAFTFSKICDAVPDAVINPTYVSLVLESFIHGLAAEPRVATNVCWAFTNLAEAAYAAAEVDEDKRVETYCLSPFFEFIVEKLLETTDRPDGTQSNLRPAAYEALMEIIKNSPRDCYLVVQRTMVIILERLQQILQMETHVVNANDRAHLNDLKSLLCGTLQSVLRKVEPEDAPKISDPIMQALLQMLTTNTGNEGGVQEDALMAVSTLVDVLDEQFHKYMAAFKPFLEMGLKSYQEDTVCCAAVGVTGDIFRVLKLQALPYCADLMAILLNILGDQSLPRSVKPPILMALGDIAMAIGSHFKTYLDVVLSCLAQAVTLSQTEIDRDDFEMFDYMNDLREGILQAYTGIIQSLRDTETPQLNEVMVVKEHIPILVNFLMSLTRDNSMKLPDGLIAGACGAILDLLTSFGAPVLAMLDNQSVHGLLLEGQKSKHSRTKYVASTAIKEMRKLKLPNTVFAGPPAASWNK